ncbi:hypothetical protein ACFXTI_022363 [Malus domestica]
MEPWIDDLVDNLQSLSFTSTITTNTNTTKCSTSSCSESLTRQLSISDLKFAERLYSNDINSVYLAELKSPVGA